MTEFEIECRSCGQSMVNFGFLSCEGQNHLKGRHSCLSCLLQKTYLKKNGKKQERLCPSKNMQTKCKNLLSFFPMSGPKRQANNRVVLELQSCYWSFTREVGDSLGKKHFIVISVILGLQIWREKIPHTGDKASLDRC